MKRPSGFNSRLTVCGLYFIGLYVLYLASVPPVLLYIGGREAGLVVSGERPLWQTVYRAPFDELCRWKLTRRPLQAYFWWHWDLHEKLLERGVITPR